MKALVAITVALGLASISTAEAGYRSHFHGHHAHYGHHHHYGYAPTYRYAPVVIVKPAPVYSYGYAPRVIVKQTPATIIQPRQELKAADATVAPAPDAAPAAEAPAAEAAPIEPQK